MKKSEALTSPCVGGGERQRLLESRLQVQKLTGCLGGAGGKEQENKDMEDKSVTH